MLSERVYACWIHLVGVWARLSVWLKIPLIFGASRLFAFLLFTVVGRQQVVSPWGSGPTSYLSFISFWDAGWYEQIARNGYPSVLPRDEAGLVTENAWAFYPLFPYTARILATVFGLDYFVAASMLALVAGFVAAYLIFLLFRDSLQAVFPAQSCGFGVGGKALAAETGRAQHEALALWGLAAVSFMPIAPVLQVPYAESYNLIFLTATILFLVHGRWGWAAAAGVFACLSRPVGVPLGAAAGIWWLLSWVRQAQKQRKLSQGWAGAAWVSLKATGRQLAAALLICAAALFWPALAWYRTGQMDAYTATETAWRGSHLAPFMPWLHQAELYFGRWGIVLLLLVMVGFALFMLTPTVRTTLHPLLIVWTASYSFYLLLFLNPQSSLFRLLLPLFVLYLPLVALSTSRAYRGLLLVSGAALQCGWVGWLWHWKQLPGGGDYPP